MTPADDRPAPIEPDIDTDEGLEAFVLGIERPIPERLRYPETDEAFDRMIAEVDAETALRGTIPLEKVTAWVRSWGAADELPRPEPECG